MNNQTYHWTLDKNQSYFTLIAMKVSDSVTLWYKQMRYLGINSLQKYFLQLGVNYTDNINTKFYCNTDELAKATKHYNRIPKLGPKFSKSILI